MPDIGIALFAMGCDVVFNSTGAYAIDVYGRYAASAQASMMFLRSFCAFGFPLFATVMYKDLGYGWGKQCRGIITSSNDVNSIVGNSILAFVVLVVGIPAPIALWFYGPALRAKSKFVVDDD